MDTGSAGTQQYTIHTSHEGYTPKTIFSHSEEYKWAGERRYLVAMQTLSF
jgi:hypothetical protein